MPGSRSRPVSPLRLAANTTILEAHHPRRIADARATFVTRQGNPVHDFVRAAVALAPPHLSVDVAINRARDVTAVFAGPLPAAHDAASFTRCTLTATWQFAVLPSVPEYCRATHGDASPSLGKPVSSTTSASTGKLAANHRATFRRTPA